MLSRIYAKIGSSRTKSVLQYVPSEDGRIKMCIMHFFDRAIDIQFLSGHFHQIGKYCINFLNDLYKKKNLLFMTICESNHR